MDIYSTSFTNCRVIYPMTIIQPLNRFPVPYRDHLKNIIDDLHSSQCVITKFIGDNPKRAIVREALNHAARYACEYCVSKAERSNTVKTSNPELQRITETITYLQNMSGTSQMARNKDIHITSLNEIKKKLCQSKNCLLYTSPSPRD